MNMFFLVANNLGLDLVNTQIIVNGDQIDLLSDFENVMEWSVAAGVLGRSEADRIKGQWSSTPNGQNLFNAVITLRDSLKQMAEDMVNRRSVASKSLDRINEILRQRTGFFEVQRLDQGYVKRFRFDTSDIYSFLIPIAESVADLLCFGDLSLVRQCENPECVLYFYDTTKNHKRQWCSMAVCGNRAKAAAFYRRKKTRVV